MQQTIYLSVVLWITTIFMHCFEIEQFFLRLQCNSFCFFTCSLSCSWNSASLPGNVKNDVYEATVYFYQLCFKLGTSTSELNKTILPKNSERRLWSICKHSCDTPVLKALKKCHWRFWMYGHLSIRKTDEKKNHEVIIAIWIAIMRNSYPEYC